MKRCIIVGGADINNYGFIRDKRSRLLGPLLGPGGILKFRSPQVLKPLWQLQDVVCAYMVLPAQLLENVGWYVACAGFVSLVLRLFYISYLRDFAL